MGFEFPGRVCVVTGAAGGIGLACALAFREAGAVVVVSDRDAERLAEVAERHDLVGIVADVGTEEGVMGLADAVEAAVGPVDLWMSNAGVALGQGLGASAEDWEVSWRVNAMAHVWAAKRLVPGMRERGGGYLVSTSSAAGLLMEPTSATYTLTKHAAVAFAEWLAVHHGDVIGVSVLCPQGVRTAMLDTVSGEGAKVTLADGILEPEQVAAEVVAAVGEGRFLITPHEQVRRYEAGKVADRDRWIAGMRRAVFGG